MTPEELSRWQRRNGLRTDAAAAFVLGISVGTYRRKRKGRIRISRATELLTLYYEVHHAISPLRIAEVIDTLGRVLRLTVIRR